MIPLLRPLRLLGSLTLVTVLVTGSWPRMTKATRVFFVLWALVTLALGARNPASAMAGGVLFALFARRQFVPWIGAQSRRQLIGFSGSFVILFIVRVVVQRVTHTVPAYGLFVRLDQARLARRGRGRGADKEDSSIDLHLSLTGARAVSSAPVTTAPFAGELSTPRPLACTRCRP